MFFDALEEEREASLISCFLGMPPTLVTISIFRESFFSDSRTLNDALPPFEDREEKETFEKNEEEGKFLRKKNIMVFAVE